jgi:hypothetical protein
MTISATTQGIRPGVATSSTRPTVPFDGQVIFETDTENLKAYNGSAWVTQNALQLVKTQTIGTAVSSVTVSDAFSSTYDNYKITVSGGVSSALANLQLKLGSTTTGYYAAYTRVTYAGVADNAGDSNQAQWSRAGACDSNNLILHIFLLSPNLAKKTTLQGWYSEPSTTGSAGAISGFLNDSTQYTAFTITPSSGTMTGGTVRVYGIANS